jgi:hypothetical protein
MQSKMPPQTPAQVACNYYHNPSLSAASKACQQLVKHVSSCAGLRFIILASSFSFFTPPSSGTQKYIALFTV